MTTSNDAHDDDDDEDDGPVQKPKQLQRSSRRDEGDDQEERPKKSSKKSYRVDDDEDDEEDQDRPRKRSAAARSEDDDDEEDRPKKKSTAAGRTDEVRPKKKSKPALQEDDDDDDEKPKQVKRKRSADDDDDDDDDDDFVYKKPELLKAQSKGEFFQLFKAEAKEILLSPKKFFETIEPTGVEQPSIFFATCTVIYAVLDAIFHLNAILLVTDILCNAINLFVAAGIYTYALKHMGGKGTFEGTYRVIAFSKVTLLFAWISLGPIPIGQMAAMAYSVYMTIMGLERLHKLPRKLVSTLLIVTAVIGFIIHLRFGI